MMTRIPYSYENDESNKDINSNSNNENAKVRRHRSLMNLKSSYQSHIPRRSSSIDRNKSLNRSSLSSSTYDILNDIEKETKINSLSYLKKPTSTTTKDNINLLNKDTKLSSFELLSGKEKNNKLKDYEVDYYKYKIPSLSSSSSKDIKSLNDEKINSIIAKYSNKSLNKENEKKSNSMEKKPALSSSSPSSSSSSNLPLKPFIDLEFKKESSINDTASISPSSLKKTFQFKAGNSNMTSKLIDKKESIPNEILEKYKNILNTPLKSSNHSPSLSSSLSSFNITDNNTKNSTPLTTNHHSSSRLKYPMSFHKKKSFSLDLKQYRKNYEVESPFNNKNENKKFDNSVTEQIKHSEIPSNEKEKDPQVLSSNKNRDSIIELLKSKDKESVGLKNNHDINNEISDPIISPSKPNKNISLNDSLIPIPSLNVTQEEKTNVPFKSLYSNSNNLNISNEDNDLKTELPAVTKQSSETIQEKKPSNKIMLNYIDNSTSNSNSTSTSTSTSTLNSNSNSKSNSTSNSNSNSKSNSTSNSTLNSNSTSDLNSNSKLSTVTSFKNSNIDDSLNSKNKSSILDELKIMNKK
ncbi:hypothetical protein BCR32DRAFT_269345 [Anaeromyces robustus]|uniref:Uncharacterized protein n=1 Tax=Anaeromyces robustus TaxID=1754192 RepID=A0A1Y1X1P9_9FUNG|nr:hypothetical protein BCR32DRAFT_269345 [Anaeromyces robustus]|eukprot:ORX79622.1 hypothetical protein BCR32DRAFT_269345 [Anaeromyces robustus]